MSQETEKIKKLVVFKKKIEKKIEELESQLNEQRLLLEAVNIILLEQGFKHVEITKTSITAEVAQMKEKPAAQPPLQPSAKQENIIPLKTVTGEPLANIYMNQDSLHVVLAEDKNFNINTPPFRHFLIERVLEKMQEKDGELTRTGELTPDKIFSYNIIQEGDTIHEIVIKNFDANRLKELKSSIRWTLEKMYEKTEGQT